MQRFEAYSVIRRTTALMDTDLDSESIILHVKSGKIFGVAETGKRIWDMLAEPVSFADLTHQLTAEYDIDPKSCAEDVSDFLAQLIDAGILEVSPPQTKAPPV